MRKQYDDFTQLKIKDMSKAMSDMTYRYINPNTDEPTKVPPMHYEKILDQVTEKYMADITTQKFLSIMYEQLVALKKEDEKYFNQALLCMDLGLNPKDLRTNDKIALMYTNDFMEERQKEDKKNYHFLNDDIIGTYNLSKNDPEIQSETIKYSDSIDAKREADYRSRNDRDDR